MARIALLYYSKYAHIEEITKSIAEGIKTVGVEPIVMHTSAISLEQLDQADGIIFGSPTYFGSVAAELKAFFDTTSAIWNQQKWRNKIAAGFTHSSSLSGDKLNTLMQIMIFAMQHGMIWVGLDLLPNQSQDEYKLNRLGSWLGLMSQSDMTKNLPLTPDDLATAKYFGKRVANITKMFLAAKSEQA